MAYVYRHIRLDKNVPFYIGIGNEADYRRAFTKHNRNYWWNNIVKKTKYEVDILMCNISWKEAQEKEKEFISLYGRYDLGKGTLVNLTDGGEGAYGLVFTDEVKKKMSVSRGKKVAQYNLNGNFLKVYNSTMDAERENGFSNTLIGACANGRKNIFTAYDFVWKWYTGDKSDIIFDKEAYNDRKNSSKIKVSVFDSNGIFKKKFDSLIEASKQLGLEYKSLSEIINKKGRVHKGFILRYYNGDESDLDISELKYPRTGERAPMYGRKGTLSGRYGIKGKDNLNSKKIAQIDLLTNEVLKEYDSIRIAAQELSIDPSNLSKACKGIYLQVKGYKWEYIKK